MRHDQYESDPGDAQFDDEAQNDIDPALEAKKPKKNKLTASGGLRRKPAKKAAKKSCKKSKEIGIEKESIGLARRVHVFFRQSQ